MNYSTNNKECYAIINTSKKHGSPAHQKALDYPLHLLYEFGRGASSMNQSIAQKDELDLLDTESKPSGHAKLRSVTYEPKNKVVGPLVPMEPMDVEHNMNSMAPLPGYP